MNILIGTGFAAMIALICWAAISEANEWKAFRIEHKCVVVSKEQDSVGTGLSSDGKVTTIIISGKTGYRCNNGVTYYR